MFIKCAGVKEKKMSKELMRSYSTISIGDEAQRRI